MIDDEKRYKIFVKVGNFLLLVELLEHGFVYEHPLVSLKVKAVSLVCLAYLAYLAYLVCLII